jgi:hypothetical protein
MVALRIICQPRPHCRIAIQAVYVWSTHWWTCKCILQ